MVTKRDYFMDVSVIICTRNRSYAISQCLDSIAKSIIAAKSYSCEIVVIDNNSDDDTVETVKKWGDKFSGVTRCVTECQKGLSSARNRGIKESQGRLLIFTDDDCHMDTQYINIALSYAKNDKKDCIRGGRVELGDKTDLPLTIKTDLDPKTWERHDNISRRENLGNAFMGCNMIIPRKVIEKIGVFDQILGAGAPLISAEDTDFIFRCYLDHVPIKYSPDLIVHHFHGRKDIKEGWDLQKGYAIGTGALYAKYILKHPNFCRQFSWDLKNFVKMELFKGQNGWDKDVNFTLKNKLFYNIIGFFRFIRYFLLPAR